MIRVKGLQREGPESGSLKAFKSPFTRKSRAVHQCCQAKGLKGRRSRDCGAVHLERRSVPEIYFWSGQNAVLCSNRRRGFSTIGEEHEQSRRRDHRGFAM